VTLGTGVFLSAGLFGLIYLYQITRDRWSWPKIVLRGSAALASIVGLTALAVFSYSEFESIPRRPNDYADLTIGMTMDQVQYIKGSPSDVLDDDPRGGFRMVRAVKDIKADKKVQDYRSWQFSDATSSRLDVEFDPASKKLRQIACYSSDSYSCPALVGVNDGTDEDTVVKKLGRPSSEKILGPTKLIEYEPLGVWYYLAKQKVYMLGMSSTGRKVD
jgi:outer membrane protein assembly factor BamE (lipoprotein component of BamABCDE complex)